MIIGEKDAFVCNKSNRAWHLRTSSKLKEIKLMAGSYHELSKEPNNAVMFDSILQFAVKVGPTAKPFGPYDVNTVKFRSQASVLRKPKFWALSLH